MISKAKNFFTESYRRDPLATVVEIFETMRVTYMKLYLYNNATGFR